VKEEVRRILMEIPVNLLHSVMDEWIQRLRWCIELGGEYVP
jgi:hypothetical protein